MSTGSFVHLHVHTEYSMLDGAAKVGELFTEAKRLGMPAVGMTDHGNMFGAYRFHAEAKKAGVTPIIGIEAYLAPESRWTKTPIFWGTGSQRDVDPDGEGGDVSGAGAYTHMTMLAANATGLRNLFRLSSLASIEGYYRKPRMDAELVAQHAEGIIATTGCPSGEVQTRLRLGQFDAALAAAGTYREIFGRENFFLELMDHGLAIERSVRDGLLDIGRRLGLRPLATNDSHYVTRDHAGAHEVLLCVGTGRQLSDPKRFKFDGDGYYLKAPTEMRALWDDEVPGACDSSLLIAERVESYDEVFAHVDRMPRFPVPEGETEQSWLRTETERGMRRRFGDSPSAAVRERIEHELGVITAMGFPGYFLVVADICAHARTQGIRVGPGRGSATGSMVSYALGITELDPIEHRLIFERFLNPERVSPPDIDLDFDERRRGDMIRYVTEKYGDDRVCQIITFGTIKAKAAVKDSARVLGYPYPVGEKITKAMPPDIFGATMPLAGVLDPGHPRYAEAASVRGLYESDQAARHIIDTALGLEELTRGAGVHAAGVILSSAPLLDVLPVHRREKDGAIISGFPFTQAEDMGLLKMDFLGLRNLTVIDDAITNVRRNRGVEVDLERLPLADRPTFELLARGDTLGVFQLDGGAMRNLLRLMAPSEFEDIAAVLALYRPGPMAANSHIEYADRKNGRKPVVPIHPELAGPLEDILGATYHLVVYQEQVMTIARELAGYSLGRADLLRRAMGKKKKDVLDAHHAEFTAGMTGRGFSAEAAQALWDVLVPFSGYGFNKSHTAGYGVVAFWTAYLKANFPAEYMAALLTSVGDDKAKMATYLAECRRIGVQVLPPDVNESGLHFTPAGERVRFGLGAVRGIGSTVVESITATRRERGAFASFADFLDKAEVVACTKQAIGALIQAGAFDSLGHHRRPLLEGHEAAIGAAVPAKKREAAGHLDLFAETAAALGEQAPARPGALDLSGPEWPQAELLARERDMLGLYVSGHPLHGTQELLERHSTTSLAELVELGRDGQDVRIAGLISKVEQKTSKASGAPWAVVTVEDLGGMVEVLFFARTYQEFARLIAVDAVASIRGWVNEREGAKSVYGDRLTVLDTRTAATETTPVGLALPAGAVTQELVDRLRVALEAHPGRRPVHLRIDGEQGRWTLAKLGPTVAATRGLRGELDELLGAGAVTSWPVSAVPRSVPGAGRDRGTSARWRRGGRPGPGRSAA